MSNRKHPFEEGNGLFVQQRLGGQLSGYVGEQQLIGPLFDKLRLRVVFFVSWLLLFELDGVLE